MDFLEFSPSTGARVVEAAGQWDPVQPRHPLRPSPAAAAYDIAVTRWCSRINESAERLSGHARDVAAFLRRAAGDDASLATHLGRHA